MPPSPSVEARPVDPAVAPYLRAAEELREAAAAIEHLAGVAKIPPSARHKRILRLIGAATFGALDHAGEAAEWAEAYGDGETRR